MTNVVCAERFESQKYGDALARRLHSDQIILPELIRVLAAHPGGLRRWSVMRAIRSARERALRDIPHKFEDEVERTFRRYCADKDDADTRVCLVRDAFFYRPREKTGEVWALIPDRAKVLPDARSVGVE